MNPEELLAHADFVKSLARSLVLDEHQAANIAQETWVAALEHPPSAEKPLRAWLAKVTRNFIHIMYRSETSRRKRERAASVPDLFPSPQEIATREESRRSMIEAVLGLDEPYRTVILLRFYHDLPARRVAERLGVPHETVKTRIQRGLEQLRLRLDIEHGGDRKKWRLAFAPLAGLKLTSSAGAATSATTILTGVLAMAAKIKTGAAAALFLGTISLLFLMLKDDEGAFGDFGAPASFSETNSDLAAHKDHDGVGPSETDPELFLAKLAIEPSLQLKELTGRVLAKEDGRGIADARVAVNLLPFRNEAEALEVQTDGSGNFALCVPIGEDRKFTSFHFHVSAEDFVKLETARPFIDSAGSQKCGSFYLEGNEKYAIRVIDNLGNALPGARVEFIKDSIATFLVKKISDSEGLVSITDQELLCGPVNSMAVRATAAGMSDGYFYLDGNHQIPTVIEMAPEAYWAGRVIDSETALGIASAKVSLRNVFFEDIMSEDCRVETDANGRFLIKRLCCPEGVIFKVEARADGYLPTSSMVIGDYPERVLKSRILDDWAVSITTTKEFPELIEMERVSLVKKAIVMDGSTGLSLPHLEFLLTLNGEDVEMATDESGCFLCPFRSGAESSLRLQAPGFRSVDFDSLDPDRLGNEPWIIRLKPLAQEDLKIFVRDELGHPVVGAYAFLEFRSGNSKCGQTRYTGLDGEARFKPFFTERKEMRVSIRRAGFLPFHSESFLIGHSQEMVRTFVLKWGNLVQKIRVKDDMGELLADIYLSALLFLEDGSVANVRGSTNEQGLCEMAFPSFHEGLIYVDERPDTCVSFSRQAVLDDEWITIVLFREVAESSLIQGVVLDESGRSLEGVFIEAFTMDTPMIDSYAKSGEDGSFSVIVFKDMRYRLRFSPERFGSRWYTAEDIYNVVGGAKPNISMSPSSNRVSVSLSSLYEGKDYDLSVSDAWLEHENGQPLSEYGTLKIIDGFDVQFFGVPPGRFRAVIESGNGERHRTRTFEIEDAQSIEIAVAPAGDG